MSKRVIRAYLDYVIADDMPGMRLYFDDGTTEMFLLEAGVTEQLKEFGNPIKHMEWLEEWRLK